MNAIRATQALNKRELENAVPPSASWHADYRDTAYVYVGGLPLDLSEGDVVAIFSQYGEPTHLNLVRDRDTGKSRGFAFLKYADQRSCDLAVDNLGGSEVLGRMLRVDHSRYRKREGEDEETWRIGRLEAQGGRDREGGEGTDGRSDGDGDGDGDDGDWRRKRRKKARAIEDAERAPLKEKRELQKLLADKGDGEDEDPMRDYIIREKREEVARVKEERRDRDRGRQTEREERRRRKHHHRRRDEDADEDPRGHRDRDRDRDRDRHGRDDGETSRRRRHRDDESDDGNEQEGRGNDEDDGLRRRRHHHRRDNSARRHRDRDGEDERRNKPSDKTRSHRHADRDRGRGRDEDMDRDSDNGRRPRRRDKSSRSPESRDRGSSREDIPMH